MSFMKIKFTIIYCERKYKFSWLYSYTFTNITKKIHRLRTIQKTFDGSHAFKIIHFLGRSSSQILNLTRTYTANLLTISEKYMGIFSECPVTKS